MGVLGPGKDPEAAEMAAPYVPSWRFRYLAWVRGDPTRATCVRLRMSGMARSSARQSTWLLSSCKAQSLPVSAQQWAA